MYDHGVMRLNLESVPCETLELLAVPYREHADCRPEWTTGE
ncbi:MAG: hypothetical protein ACRDTO_00710 [Mycobacterium sp.]